MLPICIHQSVRVCLSVTMLPCLSHNMIICCVCAVCACVCVCVCVCVCCVLCMLCVLCVCVVCVHVCLSIAHTFSSLPLVPNPSSPHAVVARSLETSFPHTVPHCPRLHTSRRPLYLSVPSASLRAPSEHGRAGV